MPAAPSHPRPDRATRSVGEQGTSRAVIARSIRSGLLCGLAVATVVCLALLLFAGPSAAWSGLVGAALGLGAFWTGTLVARLLVAAPMKGLVLVAVAMFVLHLALLVMLALVLSRALDLEVPALATGLVLTGLAYQAGLSAGVLRGRTLIAESVQSP